MYTSELIFYQIDYFGDRFDDRTLQNIFKTCFMMRLTINKNVN
jgi:hypothetical protein